MLPDAMNSGGASGNGRRPMGLVYASTACCSLIWFRVRMSRCEPLETDGGDGAGSGRLDMGALAAAHIIESGSVGWGVMGSADRKECFAQAQPVVRHACICGCALWPGAVAT